MKKSMLFVGIILGAILGIIGFLFWYIGSGEFAGVMAGSGFSGLIVVMCCGGGVPGAIVGAILGVVLSRSIG